MNGEHAHPFRFLDRVVDGPLDRRVVIKAVTAGERAPEALVFEAMAQAALPLAGPRHAAGVPGMLVAIHEARLLRAVGPGDRLRISARVTERFGDLVRVRSQADVEGVIVAEGEFSIAIGGMVEPEASGGGARGAGARGGPT